MTFFDLLNQPITIGNVVLYTIWVSMFLFVGRIIAYFLGQFSIIIILYCIFIPIKGILTANEFLVSSLNSLFQSKKIV